MGITISSATLTPNPALVNGSLLVEVAAAAGGACRFAYTGLYKYLSTYAIQLIGDGTLTLLDPCDGLDMLLIGHGYTGGSSSKSGSYYYSGAGGKGGYWLYNSAITLAAGSYSVAFTTTTGGATVFGDYSSADGTAGGTGGTRRSKSASSTTMLTGNAGTGGTSHTFGDVTVAHSGGGGSGADSYTSTSSISGGNGVKGGGSGGSVYSSTAYAGSKGTNYLGGGGGGGALAHSSSTSYTTKSGGSGGTGSVILYREEGWQDTLHSNIWLINDTVDFTGLDTILPLALDVTIMETGATYTYLKYYEGVNKYIRADDSSTGSSGVNVATDYIFASLLSIYPDVAFGVAPTGDFLTWLEANATRMG